MRARGFILVWAVLIMLLALTVGATLAPIGNLKPVANLGIAVAKAALVYWFFMHLSQERGLMRVVAVGAVAWLAILGTFVAGELLSRGWLQMPV
jgi:cytochrome c oxidase subunit 4